MLYYDITDISEGVNPIKTNKRRECILFCYLFYNHGFKFQDNACNGCHVSMQLKKYLIY